MTQRIRSRRSTLVFFLLPLLVVCGWEVEGLAADDKPPTYQEWKTRCLSTPANRTLRGRFPTKDQLPIKDFQVVDDLTQTLLKRFQQGGLADPSKWVGVKPEKSKFFDLERTYYTRSSIPFQPFAQKLQVEPGSELIFHGDFHGDVRSFLSTLEWLNQSGRLDGFKLKKRDTYLVFLGDYADRGAYGVEVIYTLLRLKMANPDRVFMARGNHEDFQLTATYGFLREGQTKYGREFNPFSIWRMFDFLPVVIYAGTGGNFVQCNHGGMEPGYDPSSLLNASGGERYQLLGELRQKTFKQRHPDFLKGEGAAARQLADLKMLDFTPQSPTTPAPLGFMWNDYSLFGSDPGLAFNPDRLAFIFGEPATKYLLKAASKGPTKLRAVFRAHQHSSLPNPMMHRLVVSKGAFRHWQATDRPQESDRKRLPSLIDTTADRTVPEGSVWTFNVAPDSVYGEANAYTFDTIGVLKTAKAFKDWRLRVVNVVVKLN